MAEKVTKTVTFKREKDTKNAVRFQEESEVPVIGPLYVQKAALQAMGDVKAERVQVTIEIA